MRKVSRVLSYVSAFTSAWLLVRSPPGPAGGIVWLPKLWSGAWAPFLAILGGLGALAGLARGDRKAVCAGLFGAAVAARYTARVAREHDGFDQAFGAGWQGRIPPSLRARVLKGRYRLLQPKPPAVPGRRDVVLGTRTCERQPLLADIWDPPGGVARTQLAVVYLHGGLWNSLDKGFLSQPLVRRLAGQGHVVMDVAYSLAPRADLNDMMHDVIQAIAWIQTHAAQYGVDPERIVLMGTSGGGHLALLAAYGHGDSRFAAVPRFASPPWGASRGSPLRRASQAGEANVQPPVRAVVSFFGPTDLVAFFDEYGRANPKQPESRAQIGEDLRPRVRDATPIDRFLTRTGTFPEYRYGNMPGDPLVLFHLLGGTPSEAPDRYRQGSPLAQVGSHCPPTLQVFGDDDFAVDASHGRRLHKALQEAGVPSVYVEFPGAVHAFDQYLGVSRRVAPAAQAATQDLERFLALMV
jgi:acetyl esterase/lipase